MIQLRSLLYVPSCAEQKFNRSGFRIENILIGFELIRFIRLLKKNYGQWTVLIKIFSRVYITIELKVIESITINDNIYTFKSTRNFPRIDGVPLIRWLVVRAPCYLLSRYAKIILVCCAKPRQVDHRVPDS